MTDHDGSTSKPLVDFLQEQDARCPVCSYNLRACPSSRCPECGAELSLTVVVPGALGGWWMAGVFGVGLSAVLTTMLVIMQLGKVGDVLQQPVLYSQVNAGIVSTSALPRWSPIIITTILAVLSLSALAWLLTTRRHFLQRPRAWQVIVGLLCAGSAIIIFGVVPRFSFFWF